MQVNESEKSFHRIMTEIIIAFGIFVIISVIIAKMFFNANDFSKDAINNSQATLQAESIAEALKGSDSFQAAAEAIGMKPLKGNETSCFIMNFDKSWNQVADKGSFVIRVEITSEPKLLGSMEEASIIVLRADRASQNKSYSANTLCRINVKKYRH